VEQEAARPSLLIRFVALVVLVVAAWVLLKIVLHLILGLSLVVIAVLAVVGILWALSKF
jgi:uncharacterized membrane protein YccC